MVMVATLAMAAGVELALARHHAWDGAGQHNHFSSRSTGGGSHTFELREGAVGIQLPAGRS